jgi:hypothetical protein
MKIAAVSMIKNECDIIELFIRINARAVDHFYILDNGSSDATLPILHRLIDEGFPITLSSDDTVDYPQDQMTTSLINYVANTGKFDWIFPVDADEFIQSDRKSLHSALTDVPPDYCGFLNWVTFVPTSTRYFDCENPLWSEFRQRCSEFRQRGKVIIPLALAKNGRVGMGNHKYKSNGQTANTQILNIALAHVPARSPDQLLSKVLIGSHKFSIKQNRRRGEGFHWDGIAVTIRSNNYALDYPTLKNVALSYGLDAGDPTTDQLVDESRIGCEDDCIRYSELAQINPQQRFDAFIGDLCREINRHRRRTGLLSIFSGIKHIISCKSGR